MKKGANILWFRDLTINDIAIVGGKNASLGEMYRELTKKTVRIPHGFAITATAYQHYITSTGIDTKLRALFKHFNHRNITKLQHVGAAARNLFLKTPIPKTIQDEICTAYAEMSRSYKTRDVAVAVRSSATAEDLPTASFAGQQETFLNIRGPAALIDACQRCFASLFTNRAIAYREENGFDHSKVYLSIGVQKMVHSDKSGVMFTIDTETGFPHAVVINAAYGLGENVVQGKVNPDQYIAFKPTLATHTPIISKHLGDKNQRMIYATGKNPVRNIPVSKAEQNTYCLTDADILTLARWGVIIEDHYTKKRKTHRINLL